MQRSAPLPATQRWALVGQRLREESRTASTEKKLMQLAALMDSVDDFGWRQELALEDDRVRDLWLRLRAAWKRG